MKQIVAIDRGYIFGQNYKLSLTYHSWFLDPEFTMMHQIEK